MKAILTDGRKKRMIYADKKTVNPWDPDDSPEAWVGAQAAVDKTHLVPAVYAAWQTRCKAMADLPFCIYGKGDTVIDDSDDYKNQTGLLQNPRNFFWLTEASLAGYGCAYWLKNPNKFNIVKGLQYIRPDTVTPKIEMTGLKEFERQLQTTKQTYKPDDILYIWLPDASVEIGPPTVYPLLSALLSAGALDKISAFIKDFMERGAVKAMILAAKNMPDPAEANRVENWFNKFMRGVATRWRMFNAEEITPTVIGEGLEAFKGIEITDDLTRQVNTAFGTRQMLEDENYATAQIRQREFYLNTVMPDARLIADCLNEQVLNLKGYHLEFEPERLEVFQKDESANAAALTTVMSAFLKANSDNFEILAVAMELLGLDITEEQLERLKNAVKKPEPEQPAPAPEDVKPLEAEPDEDLEDAAIEREMDAEMRRWERKALKALAKGKPAAVEFVSDKIPRAAQLWISNKLMTAKTEADVNLAFYHPPVSPAPVMSEGMIVLEAIRAEVEAIKAAHV